MDFRYLEEDNEHHLIDHFYQLKIDKKDLPFKSLVLPLGQTNITYIKSEEKQLSKHNGKDAVLYDGLVVTGQCYGSFEISVPKESYNFGFSLKPTSLYKILGQDISLLNNSHSQLKSVNQFIYEKLNPLFKNNIDDIDGFVKAIYKFLDNYEIIEGKNVTYIDQAIDLITKKEGLLKVNDLLELTPFSQKALELNFKKIIGLTPGKYIKQYRFVSLMKKYERNKISLKDLQYNFNYYDSSHFSKDFQIFMNQTPKSYFKKDYPLLKSYLKK